MLDNAASRLITKLLDEIDELSETCKNQAIVVEQLNEYCDKQRDEIKGLTKLVDDYEEWTGRYLNMQRSKGTKFVHKEEYYRVVDEYNELRLKHDMGEDPKRNHDYPIEEDDDEG